MSSPVTPGFALDVADNSSAITPYFLTNLWYLEDEFDQLFQGSFRSFPVLSG